MKDGNTVIDYLRSHPAPQRTLELARACTYDTAKCINPTLYGLKRIGKIIQLSTEPPIWTLPDTDKQVSSSYNTTMVNSGAGRGVLGIIESGDRAEDSSKGRGRGVASMKPGNGRGFKGSIPSSDSQYSNKPGSGAARLSAGGFVPGGRGRGIGQLMMNWGNKVPESNVSDNALNKHQHSRCEDFKNFSGALPGAPSNTFSRPFHGGFGKGNSVETQKNDSTSSDMNTNFGSKISTQNYLGQNNVNYLASGAYSGRNDVNVMGSRTYAGQSGISAYLEQNRGSSTPNLYTWGAVGQPPRNMGRGQSLEFSSHTYLFRKSAQDNSAPGAYTGRQIRVSFVLLILGLLDHRQNIGIEKCTDMNVNSDH